MPTMEHCNAPTEPASRLSPEDVYSSSFLRLQAKMTSPARRFLLEQSCASRCGWLLDIGCGYGDVLLDFVDWFGGLAIGLEIDVTSLKAARTTLPRERIGLIMGDAHHLPIRDQTCPLISIYFTLMWVHHPADVIQSVRYALKSDGFFMGMEPDYTGRIESTTHNAKQLGHLSRFIETLRRLGADPLLGHRLLGMLEAAGFKLRYFGILGWEYHTDQARQELLEEERLVSRVLGASGMYPNQYTYTPVFQYLAQQDASFR